MPVLIVNADDWGRDAETTNRTLECVAAGAVNAVSAMVFMADSGRAAELAREHSVDAGLHLNLTAEFTEPGVPEPLRRHQERVARYLLGSRAAQAVYHPGLRASFAYSVRAQLEEYGRLYGELRRADGHHHMHLCANVLWGDLLPHGIAVRRNFSFWPGEKSFLNRWYRERVDRVLAGRFRLTDYFFSLPPLEPARIARMRRLAAEAEVEAETHPVKPDEYRFLMSGGLA